MEYQCYYGHLRIKINDKNFEWRFNDSLIIFKFYKVRLLKVLYILRMGGCEVSLHVIKNYHVECSEC